MADTNKPGHDNYPMLPNVEASVITEHSLVQGASPEQSRLLRLPVELRVVILRQLLLTENPIARPQTYVRQIYNKPLERPRNSRGQFQKRTIDRIVDGHHLTLAVLMVCRLLLEEGRPILYEENRLMIQVYAGRSYMRYNRYTFVYALNDELASEPRHASGLTEPGLALLSRFKHVQIELNVDYSYLGGTEMDNHRRWKVSYCGFTQIIGKLAPSLDNSCVHLATTDPTFSMQDVYRVR